MVAPAAVVMLERSSPDDHGFMADEADAITAGTLGVGHRTKYIDKG